MSSKLNDVDTPGARMKNVSKTKANMTAAKTNDGDTTLGLVVVAVWRLGGGGH